MTSLHDSKTRWPDPDPRAHLDRARRDPDLYIATDFMPQFRLVHRFAVERIALLYTERAFLVLPFTPHRATLALVSAERCLTAGCSDDMAYF